LDSPIFLYDDKIGKVEYVQHMGTDLTIVNSARVSFGKESSELKDKDERLIRYLVKNKHTSTFEHNVVTFRFTVPIFVRSQHHRHRTWSYNEISRRYTDRGIRFYEPSLFRTQHESNRQASNDEYIDPIVSYPRKYYPALIASSAVKEHGAISLEFYNRMVESGICREQARMVLPQNMYTQYYGTVNLSNLLKFIRLRADEHSQQEIRVVAEACLDIAGELWPVAVKNYRDFIS
jgi:thymidylate synthase (FAD)